MFQELGYSSVFIFLIISIFIALIAVIMPTFFGPTRQTNIGKNNYECGVKSLFPNNEKNMFNIKFYLVAVLFIIFDVEIAFLIPWAISIKHTMYEGFISITIFNFFLLLGLIYEIKNKVIEW